MAKSNKTTQENLHLAFEVEHYSMDTSIHRNWPLFSCKLADLNDDDLLWHAGTYVEITGFGTFDTSPDEKLNVLIYGVDDSLLETKKDLLEMSVDDFGRQTPKTRTRKGQKENVYRDVKGLTLANRRKQCRSTLVHYPPIYVSHILRLLDAQNDEVPRVHMDVMKESRNYWVQNFSISNDPENW